MPLSLTPAERTMRARIAASTRWAHASADDRKRQGATLSAGRQRRFEHEVDPDRTLSAAERARRAENAMRAHMSRMQLASSKARRKARAK